jgi:hypothetical protein
MLALARHGDDGNAKVNGNGVFLSGQAGSSFLSLQVRAIIQISPRKDAETAGGYG